MPNDKPKLVPVVRFKLEKFDGDYEPGKEPVEVIEGGDGIETKITKREDPECR